MAKHFVLLVALALVASVAAIDATDDSMNTCTGGGAFGMFRRQPGCAINNCQCFPVLFQCDATLGDGHWPVRPLEYYYGLIC